MHDKVFEDNIHDGQVFSYQGPEMTCFGVSTIYTFGKVLESSRSLQLAATIYSCGVPPTIKVRFP